MFKILKERVFVATVGVQFSFLEQVGVALVARLKASVNNSLIYLFPEVPVSCVSFKPI
ncbi:MAG: hypothetical protein V4449_02805 [Patescibacteria group bacterium]